MSTEVSRKATFILHKGEGKNRIYKAVNKRGHTVCKKAGHKFLVSITELRAMRNSGSYKFYEYTDGSLKFIR